MIVKLTPLSYFRGSSPPASDTIFGGICWGLTTLYGKEFLEDILNEFNRGNPPFIISSAFPWIKDKYFLPRPVTKGIGPGDCKKEIKKRKKLKKITYINSHLFNKIINGKKEEDILLNIKEEDYIKKLNFIDIPHNNINRLTNSSENIFYTEELYIKNGGFYFFIKFPDKSIKNKIIGAINWLCDTGIGGDGSTGKGHFRSEFLEKTVIKEASVPEAAINLSLLYLNDKDKEILRDNPEVTFYEVVKRKGKLQSSLAQTGDIWKKTVIMLKEGSILPWKKELYGKNVLVKEISHKVWQYGYGYMIGGVISWQK